MDYLKQIFSEDIELLLEDIDLLKKGYELNYIIDPSDVITYSFPYGLNFSLLGRKSLDDIGDELIAYEYIFRNYKPILLEEYKLELLKNRNNLKDNTDRRLKQNLLDVYLHDTGEMDKQYIKANLMRSATYLLATALMNDTFINKFDDLFYNKLQTDVIFLKNNNRKDQQVLTQLYKTIRRSEWSKSSFIKWAEANREDNSDPEELLNHYKSTYRDYVVIDRVCRINDAIQKSLVLDSKYIYLYYSGAKKSEDIFERPDVKSHLPVIDGMENFNLLRTPKHSYLLFLIFDDDQNKMEESLNKLKGIAEKKESNISLAKKLSKSGIVDNELFEKIGKKKREILEYISISTQIKNHMDYQKSIQNKIKKLRNSVNDSEFAETYEKFLMDAKQVNDNTGIIQLDLSYSVQGGLLNLVKNMIAKKDFTIAKGKDLIRGTYHHLPILLFFDTNSNIDRPKEKLLLKVIDYVVKSARIRRDSLNDFSDSIRGLYEEIEKVDENKEKYYDILLKFFIYTVLESPIKDQSEAYHLLKDSSVIMESSTEALDKWMDDYNYMLAWASRRNKDIEESLTICEVGIKKFVNDPRFFHGKCLALYNLNYKEDSLDSCGLDDLKKIVQSAEKAKHLYKQAMLDKKATKIEFIPFINGNILAINNLIMYCISLFYLDLMEKNQTSDDALLKKYNIDMLREDLLMTIRSQDSDTNLISKELPEFLHSESILELVEAIDAYNKLDFGNSNNKIKLSLQAIEAAIQCEPTSNLYTNTKVRINAWRSRISHKTY